MNIKTNSRVPSLMTKTIMFDGSENWSFFKSNDDYWAMWGYINIPDCPTYQTSQVAKLRSNQVKCVSQWDLTAQGTQGKVCSYSQDLVVRLNDLTIDTLEKFKAYLQENPITIEYLLAESDWGGLH